MWNINLFVGIVLLTLTKNLPVYVTVRFFLANHSYFFCQVMYRTICKLK